MNTEKCIVRLSEEERQKLQGIVKIFFGNFDQVGVAVLYAGKSRVRGRAPKSRP